MCPFLNERLTRPPHGAAGTSAPTQLAGPFLHPSLLGGPDSRGGVLTRAQLMSTPCLPVLTLQHATDMSPGKQLESSSVFNGYITAIQHPIVQTDQTLSAHLQLVDVQVISNLFSFFLLPTTLS